jgi:hypothetical protein
VCHPFDARSSRIQSGQTCGFARLFGARAVAGVEAETSTNLRSGRFMRKTAGFCSRISVPSRSVAHDGKSGHAPATRGAFRSRETGAPPRTTARYGQK